MAQPYIRINQFEANYSDVGVKSATGHVNFTFIDGNGVNKGTFGANQKIKIAHLVYLMKKVIIDVKSMQNHRIISVTQSCHLMILRTR